MRIIRDYKACQQVAKGSVIALGNFDGIHKGHLAVINKAKAVAKSCGSEFSVLTFEPHPVCALKDNITPFRLTSEVQKIDIIEKLGANNLFIINFTKAFAQIKAADFIKDILVDGFGAKHIVTGEDFIFGHNREGNAEFLAKSSAEYGFGYDRVFPVGAVEGAFSSTLIRKALAAGDLQKSKTMLDRNFIIEGVVEQGNQQGRVIGFPTINIDMGEYLRPVFGVYAVKIRFEGRGEEFSGAANIGIRPTINGTKELLEVHIFDFSENIYGHKVAVELIEYIRSEMKFCGLDELKKQISDDCNKIRKILA